MIKKIYKSIEKAGSILFFEKQFQRKQLNEIIQLGEGYETILELGVGKSSYFNYPGRKHKIIGVDLYEKNLILAKSNGVIDDYIKGNVQDINKIIEPKSFDLVCAFDLIEHLPKEKGYDLINNMEKIARKRIILYTPNGFQPQPPREDNPFQEHLSGWSYDEMKALGFHVIGLNGFKPILGMYALPKYRPYFFFRFLSNISWFLLNMFSLNKYQYGILCHKDIN